jgi:hypothetical protein
MPSAHVLGVFCTCYLEPSIVFKAKVARHVRMLIWYLFIIDKCHGCLSTWITILKWGNFSIISFQCRVLSTMDCLYVLFPGHYIVCPWISAFDYSFGIFKPFFLPKDWGFVVQFVDNVGLSSYNNLGIHDITQTLLKITINNNIRMTDYTFESL